MCMYDVLCQYFDKDIVVQTLEAVKYNRICGERNFKKYKTLNLDLELCMRLYFDLNLPLYKIGMLYGVSDATIRNLFLAHNVPLKGHRVGKNNNNSYFENINSEDRAYFLGLITADGNLYHVKHKGEYLLQLSLTESDDYILKLFNKYADFKTELVTSHKEDKKPRSLLRASSKKIYHDLTELGLAPNKSHLELHMPFISDELLSHYIRGYFDGDGIANSKGHIGFCGCYTLMNEIKRKLIFECNVRDNKVTYNKSNRIYYVQWCSKKDIKSIFDYLYQNKKDLFLIRKYNKIKEHFC